MRPLIDMINKIRSGMIASATSVSGRVHPNHHHEHSRQEESAMTAREKIRSSRSFESS